VPTPTATVTIIGNHVETVRRTVTPEEAADGITVSSTYRTSITGSTRFCCFTCAREVGEFYSRSLTHAPFTIREVTPKGTVRKSGWTIPAVTA
jgi:hypothetical protein